MQCEIITIGDELLIGQVVDTNSAFMAELLLEEGISLYQITSVHDDANHIRTAIDEALQRSEIVITTGGLGPTKDDITKNVLCDYFHTTLVSNDSVKAQIEALYRDRPDVLNRLTATQWLVPANCTVLTNRVGTAPLMMWQVNGKVLFSLPGVPYEMEIAMQEQIIPTIRHMIEEHVLSFQRLGQNRTLLVAGISESALAIHLEEWETALPKNLHLAYLPKDGTIRLRLDAADEQALLDRKFEELQQLVAQWLIMTEDKSLELALGERLRAKGYTIATAESCTGGRLAALLNAHPGSSEWFMGSVVAYDNQVKRDVLSVPAEVLQTVGAVSEETVRAMAENVRQLLHTDMAIATSGIAGPSGGTKEKPVGTVWIACATAHGTHAECFHLGRLRDQITQRACTRALIMALRALTI